MHSVVPDASIRVIGNIRAMAERRLRREILYTCFGIDKAVGKGADVRRTSLIFYECSTLARVIGGRAWIDPTAGPEGTVCIGATFRAIRLRRVEAKRLPAKASGVTVRAALAASRGDRELISPAIRKTGYRTVPSYGLLIVVHNDET